MIRKRASIHVLSDSSEILVSNGPRSSKTLDYVAYGTEDFCLAELWIATA